MGHKLLLADDSITIQKVVGIIFANEDYELTVVDNGNAALEKARAIPPDIILVDALMPGMTGYEVCETVRHDPVLKHVPLLLLSGAFEPFDEEKARQSGADDCISKPFESQHLIDKVKRLIELGRERAQEVSAYESAVGAPPVAGLASEIFETPEAVISPAPIGAFFGPDETREEAIEGTVFPFAEEVVEAAPEDDLWGVFELEEIEGEETGEFVEGIEEAADAGAEPEAVEGFSFEEDEGVGLTGMEAAGAEVPEFGAGWEPEGEQVFRFQETEEGVEEEAFSFGEPCGVTAEDEIPAVEAAQAPLAGYFNEAAEPVAVSGFAEGEPAAIPSVQEADLRFAPDEEFVPVSAAIPLPGEAVSAASVSSVPAMSEEQLAAIISRISRDIIEKVVWEVVPDLAEALIKEEIRKLKEGA